MIEELTQLNIITKNGINPKYKEILLQHPVIYQSLLQHTSFVINTTDSHIRERLYCIINNLTELPTCQQCDNPVKFRSSHPNRNTYAPFCSLKCSNNNEQVKDKKKTTCQQNYGVDNPSQSEEIHQQKITTSNLKYGTDYPWQNESIQTIRTDAVIQKYGVSNVLMSPKIREHIKQKMLTLYNVEYPAQSNIIQDKIKATNLEKYGVENYNQRDKLDAITKLLDNDWIYNKHFVEQQTLQQISNELNVSDGTVGKYLHNHGYSTQLFQTSAAEQDIVNFLQEYNINVVTSNRTIISPLELDIYLPDYNIAIEYCGLYWHCSKHPRMSQMYHKTKMDACNKQNIRLLTIFEDEWVHNQNLVKNKILSILGLLNQPKVFARKCKIINVDTKRKQLFFDTHHIQGSGPGSINVGLEYNDELVACMSFIKQSNGIYILNRYATSYQIVGGFSKLLKYFKTQYDWTQIISFADLRWSVGNLYDTNGFILDKTLPPDYEYVDFKNMKRIHKFNFRHKNLPKILGDLYDPNLSETENTYRAGWYKIYHCGLLRYIINS